MQRKSKLNPAQQIAVDHTGSHLLIIAGPGTGKTHTLTHRIAASIKHLKDKEHILAITFTKKAAHEFCSRLQNLTCHSDPERSEGEESPELKNPSPNGLRMTMRGHLSKIEAGTFHGFCLKILKQYYREAGLNENFNVIEEEKINGILKELWPEQSNRERMQIYDRISLYKSSQFDNDIPQEVLLYNNALANMNLLDFDDILLKVYRLLKNNPVILKNVQQTYPYIFIDEYQDVNAIQHSLLKMWVGALNHLTAIGDPNQAIYGFRGSDIAFFESFAQDFAPAAQLSLNENFRSLSFIIDASNQIMQKSASAYIPKVTSKIYSKGKLVIHQASTEKAEAEFAVHTIEKLIGGTSMFSQDTKRVGKDDLGEVSFGDIAVLYRLNSQTRALKEAFDRSGMPYHISIKESEDDICPRRTMEADIDVEKISFLTLHAAKGLEFPVVFILGCEENLLPLHLEGLPSNPEEERRLFYVGMTRAKYRLYLLSSRQRYLWGKLYQNKLSPFVQDIEDRLKEEELQKIKKKKFETQLTLFKN